MPFTFPTESTFRDVEDIVCDYLDDILSEVTPQVSSYTFLPDELDEILNDELQGAVVLVTRVGGAADYGSGATTDTAAISLSVFSNTRADSWSLVSYIRQRLYEDSSGFFVRDARVTKVDETTGPFDQPFEDPLRRVATFYFNITVRRNTR